MPDPARIRILVVDDDATLGATLGKMLARAGYDIALASSGRGALELAAAGGDYALVLTDVRMPDMSGPAFVMRLQQESFRPPVVVFMSGASDEWLASLRALGGLFLKKPFSRTELLDLVASATAQPTSRP